MSAFDFRQREKSLQALLPLAFRTMQFGLAGKRTTRRSTLAQPTIPIVLADTLLR
jgi:hypothetical protein